MHLMWVVNMQGLALPGLGRMKNGQSLLRASTFYKMVHLVSIPCIASLSQTALLSFWKITTVDSRMAFVCLCNDSPKMRVPGHQRNSRAPSYTLKPMLAGY